MSDFKAKRTKIDFGWGSAPDPAGELTALPQTPGWIQGAILLREWRGKGGKGKGKEEEGMEGEGKE